MMKGVLLFLEILISPLELNPAPRVTICCCIEALFSCVFFCFNKTDPLFRFEIWNSLLFSIFLTDIIARRSFAPGSTLDYLSHSSFTGHFIATVTVDHTVKPPELLLLVPPGLLGDQGREVVS